MSCQPRSHRSGKFSLLLPFVLTSQVLAVRRIIQSVPDVSPGGYGGDHSTAPPEELSAAEEVLELFNDILLSEKGLDDTLAESAGVSETVGQALFAARDPIFDALLGTTLQEACDW